MGNRKFFLVVEDDSELLGLMEELLKNDGHAVVTCKTVTEAIQKSNNQCFAGVFLDLHLEDNSGLRVVQHLRSDNSPGTLNRTTPIILVSGNVNSAILKVVANQVQAVLTKPFKSKLFLEKVQEILAKSS